MNYQIVNSGANISLITERGEEVISKKNIHGIIIVGNDKLRIDTLTNTKSYLIAHKEVNDPVCDTIIDLANLLQSWCEVKK